jgi:hypothetical protein
MSRDTVFDFAPEAEVTPNHFPNQTEDDTSAMGIHDTTEIPSEVREFCARKPINLELEQTIVLANRHFAMIGKPRFQVVDDPECGEHYVGIHIQAEGQPEDVFRKSESFFDSFLDRIEPEKQKHISLIYHPTSD